MTTIQFFDWLHRERLRGGAGTDAELAQRSGLSEAEVRRHIILLFDAGAVQAEAEWYPCTSPEEAEDLLNGQTAERKSQEAEDWDWELLLKHRVRVEA